MPDAMEPIKEQAEKAYTRTGRLELTFQQSPEGRTYLGNQYSSYPFHICRAHYMDRSQPDMATLYLQSCSGGIFRGDRHSINLLVKENACAHVTTQASTIIHRMEEDYAEQVTTIEIEQRALAEYLPDCTILFPEARFRSSITATCHPNSDLLLCDSFLAHDPDGSGKAFSRYDNELILKRPDGTVLAIDRYTVTGDDFKKGETGEINPFSVHGTFVVVSQKCSSAQISNRLREITDTISNAYIGVSALPNQAGCWVRFLAKDGVVARQLMEDIWLETRLLLTRKGTVPRRK